MGKKANIWSSATAKVFHGTGESPKALIKEFLKELPTTDATAVMIEVTWVDEVDAVADCERFDGTMVVAP